MWLAAAFSLALVHADVVDFASGALLEDVTVLVRDGLITDISATAAVPEDAEVLDLRGRTLVPGFIDVHSHVSTSDEALRALRSGITTLRVLGVEHYKDVGLRELRRRRAIEAPEISRYDEADYPLYEITSSPMTQLFSPTGRGWSEEPNRHRVSEGNYRYPNFGLVTIDWAAKAVTLEIRGESNRAVFGVRVPIASLRHPSD